MYGRNGYDFLFMILAAGVTLGYGYIRDTYEGFPYLTLLQKILRLISYGFVLFVILYLASWYILRLFLSVYSINFSFLIPAVLFVIVVFIEFYIYDSNHKHRR